MHGLAADVDLGFLLGQQLTQVIVSRHQLQLAFLAAEVGQSGALFLIEDDLAVGPTVKEARRYSMSTEAAPQVLPLLDHVLERWQSFGDGTLELHFGGSGSIILYDSSPAYESYQIRCGDDWIVV